MNRGRGGFGSDRGRGGGRGFSNNRGNGFTPRGRGNFQNRDKFQSERKPRKFGEEDDDEMEEDEVVPKKGGKSKSLPNTPLAGKGGPKNELNGNEEEDESDSGEELDVNDEGMEEEEVDDESGEGKHSISLTRQ